jgi:glutathionyl-hydroquinone reductase
MWIMMELPLVLGFQFRNKNIERGTDTNSTQSSVEELQKLMDNYRNKAEWYSERVTRFLLANDGDYPLYSNPTSEIDTILPTRRNYTSGMVLDRSGCCGSFSEKYQANYNRTCCD